MATAAVTEARYKDLIRVEELMMDARVLRGTGAAGSTSKLVAVSALLAMAREARAWHR